MAPLISQSDDARRHYVSRAVVEVTPPILNGLFWKVSFFLISTLFLKWVDLFAPDQQNGWEESGDNGRIFPLGASAVGITPASGSVLICSVFLKAHLLLYLWPRRLLPTE